MATNSSTSIFWTLQPGNWVLQVKSGKMSDQVSLAESKIREGFSVK